MVSPISPCGTFRIIEGTIGGAKQVLDDLSLVERIERQRLGIESDTAVYRAVAEERAWVLIPNTRPFKSLAIFGVSGLVDFPAGPTVRPARYVWFLPTQHLIDNYKRDVVDPTKVKWVLDWIWSSIPTAEDKAPVVLFNGATVENKTVLRWVKKVVGARVSRDVIPGGPKQAPMHPFFLHHMADYA